MEAFLDKWFIPLLFTLFVPFFFGAMIYHYFRNCVFAKISPELLSPKPNEFYRSLPKVDSVCVAGKENASLFFRRHRRSETIRAIVEDNYLHVGIPRSPSTFLYRMTNLSVPISEISFSPQVKWFGLFYGGINEFSFRVGPLCLYLGESLYNEIQEANKAAQANSLPHFESKF